MKPITYQLWVPEGLPNHPSRLMSHIRYITIHTTGNRSSTATAEAHARFQYRGGGGRQVSWHYTVDSSEIWQSFRDEQMCWHAGSRPGNESSIGIEICVNSREGFQAACENSAWLTASLLELHGLSIDDVVQHHKWNTKNCPLELRENTWGLNWEDFLIMVRRYLAENKKNPANMTTEDAKTVISSLKEAQISLDRDHWQGVLEGTIRPNRQWTKLLTSRIIDNRWCQFTPEIIGSAMMSLLGKNGLNK